MRRLPCGISLVCVLLLSSCDDATVGGAQGQTHWLHDCERDADCGELQCICGVCVAACAPAGACDVPGRDTECQSSDGTAAVALCRGDAPEPICLEPCASGCSSSERCAGGACVPVQDGGTGAGGASGSGPSGGTGGDSGNAEGGAGAGAGSGSTLDAGACRVGDEDCAPGPADGGASVDATSDAAGIEVDCTQRPAQFPTFDRSCSSAVDCAPALRQIDCCGTQIVTGVRASQLDAYEQAAVTCASQYPECDCATRATEADDGSTEDGSSSAARVVCMAGECRTTFATDGAATPCGPDLECDSATEVCVSNVALGEIIYTCQPVPAGCEAKRDCACTGDALCESPFTTCSDQGANAIGCSCLTCL